MPKNPIFKLGIKKGDLKKTGNEPQCENSKEV